ncbi:holo-ACP synthase [Buchnera aphidicola]|uniref:holo-ACP synthase n=1 Tax=Buchnera aphidicola TaxID=9 RepID=UPI0034643933
MTIISIGIDIVEISRIKKIFFNFGDKFAKRILSKYEWQEYITSKNCIAFISKRFSVKEAASKALGMGINSGIQFNQLELYHNVYGKPEMRFFKHALAQYKKINCQYIHVSITDEKKYAYSTVILEN